MAFELYCKYGTSHLQFNLRAVERVDCYYPTEKLRSDIGIDSVLVNMKKNSCKMALKGYFDLGPTSLNAMFPLIVHERDLRSNETMKVMVPRTLSLLKETLLNEGWCIGTIYQLNSNRPRHLTISKN